MAIAYVPGTTVPGRAKEALPNVTRFRNAQFYRGEVERTGVVYIGTPNPEGKTAYSRTCALIKARYEEAAKDKANSFSGEVKVEPALDLYPPQGETVPDRDLAEIVGASQAEALEEAGYGTVAAARALPKEDFVAVKGVGEASYEKLHGEG